jgi:hypothetical protein
MDNCSGWYKMLDIKSDPPSTDPPLYVRDNRNPPPKWCANLLDDLIKSSGIHVYDPIFDNMIISQTTCHKCGQTYYGDYINENRPMPCDKICNEDNFPRLWSLNQSSEHRKAFMKLSGWNELMSSIRERKKNTLENIRQFECEDYVSLYDAESE